MAHGECRGLGTDFGDDVARACADAAARSTMLNDEGVDFVRAMWSGQPFHHDGPHYWLRLHHGSDRMRAR